MNPSDMSQTGYSGEPFIQDTNLPEGDHLSVYVHLSYGQGAARWKGPDRVPYGYHHAESFGCRLTYSEDHLESAIMRLIRRSLRRFMGFDIVHAYRNRKNAKSADIIWTHTGNESLAILLLLRFSRQRQKPKIIAQSIHLFDRWSGLPTWKRYIFKRLLVNADILTVHSNENLSVCRAIFPLNDCRLVKFGISIEDFPMTTPSFRPSPTTIKVASLGNDVHRDWETLLHAFGNRSDISLKVAIPRHLSRRQDLRFRHANHCTLVWPKSLNEIHELYSWADVVVVPLLRNLHCSGITVILEAITQGKPVITADTGGLTDYFSSKEILYYQTGDARSLQNALDKCVHNILETTASISAAQERILHDDLTTFGYASRHVELSQELFGVKKKRPNKSRCQHHQMIPCVPGQLEVNLLRAQSRNAR